MTYNCGFREALNLVDSLSVRLFGCALFDFYGREKNSGSDFFDLIGDVVVKYSSNQQCNNADYISALTDYYSRDLKEVMTIDAEAMFLRDPAARSIDEVIYTYPGFYAVFCHRFAHALYEADIPVLPRCISEYAHSMTGIDIHPGACIGEGFSIDHGTGSVIGETAHIGKQVALYHGVTIGAKSLPNMSTARVNNRVKRHPTICDGCVICAGAMVLGKDTVIGNNCVIGAGVRVTSSLPPNTVIYKTNGE